VVGTKNESNVTSSGKGVFFGRASSEPLLCILFSLNEMKFSSRVFRENKLSRYYVLVHVAVTYTPKQISLWHLIWNFMHTVCHIISSSNSNVGCLKPDPICRILQVSMPRSNVIILTDPHSKFSVNQGSATLLPIEGNYSRGNLMLQRIKSYIVSLFALFEHMIRFSAYDVPKLLLLSNIITIF
jgi:hypothetical protein